MIVILVDKNGQTLHAERTERGWVCPRDGADLGDLSGYRAPRVGNRCPKCGAVICEVEEDLC